MSIDKERQRQAVGDIRDVILMRWSLGAGEFSRNLRLREFLRELAPEEYATKLGDEQYGRRVLSLFTKVLLINELAESVSEVLNDNFENNSTFIPETRRAHWVEQVPMFMNALNNLIKFGKDVRDNNIILEVPDGAIPIDQLSQLKTPTDERTKQKIDLLFQDALTESDIKEAVLVSYLLRHSEEEVLAVVEEALPLKYKDRFTERIGSLFVSMRNVCKEYMNDRAVKFIQQGLGEENETAAEFFLALTTTPIFPNALREILRSHAINEQTAGALEEVNRGLFVNHSKISTLDDNGATPYEYVARTDNQQAAELIEQLEEAYAGTDSLKDKRPLQLTPSQYKQVKGLLHGFIHTMLTTDKYHINLSLSDQGWLDISVVTADDHTIGFHVASDGQVVGGSSPAAQYLGQVMREYVTSFIPNLFREQSATPIAPLSSRPLHSIRESNGPKVIPRGAHKRERKTEDVSPPETPSNGTQEETENNHLLLSDRYSKNVQALSSELQEKARETLEKLREGKLRKEKLSNSRRDGKIPAYTVRLTKGIRFLLMQGDDARSFVVFDVGGHEYIYGQALSELGKAYKRRIFSDISHR